MRQVAFCGFDGQRPSGVDDAHQDVLPRDRGGAECGARPLLPGRAGRMSGQPSSSDGGSGSAAVGRLNA